MHKRQLIVMGIAAGAILLGGAGRSPPPAR